MTWRPVLARHVGNTTFGLVKEDGVSWTIKQGSGRPINQLIRSSFLTNLPERVPARFSLLRPINGDALSN